jgi:hypothetical protein
MDRFWKMLTSDDYRVISGLSGLSGLSGVGFGDLSF